MTGFVSMNVYSGLNIVVSRAAGRRGFIGRLNAGPIPLLDVLECSPDVCHDFVRIIREPDLPKHGRPFHPVWVSLSGHCNRRQIALFNTLGVQVLATRRQ